ncbi:hypothetical protein JZ785_25570 [Alicyclobacillus curvatus]|nr:hypothetical protein JZ785_25570 [Alicyclobacillus curvatus]
MKEGIRRYTLRVIGLMVMYTILLFVSIWVLPKISITPWRVPIAVLPAVPLLFVVWSAIQFIRTLDELQKTIHVEATTFSFLLTAVLTLTYGFLENAGLPQIPILYVPLVMCVLWGVGAGIASRKYR